jgi:hypothetical protein
MDMNGGQLSYQDIEILRSFEKTGKKHRKNTILPSSSSISHFSSVVNRYANIVVPFRTCKMKDGLETIEFHPEKVIKLIIKASDLEDVAKVRPVAIDQSIDGAQITNQQSVIVYGGKVVDPEAKIPRRKAYMVGMMTIVYNRETIALFSKLPFLRKIMMSSINSNLY